ncbi:MAG TPA: NAD(P)-dependent alcohol dehydrogenase, partial [Euzebya sp.]|nr:NAD(P)-dependent alcohol dehydrogenase [Euzebya sp.]
MRAIVQTGYGAPQRVLRLAEVPAPAVGAEDVLVQVRASSVNTPDWIAVAGVPRILRLQSGLRRPASPVRGSDVAGVVQSVGADVTDLKPGDEVFGSTWDNNGTQAHGAFAQQVAVPAAQVHRMPDGISYEEAAAAVMSGLTALIAIRDVAGAGPGTRVLINGASGGVGTFAVQIA